jgi:hypothetical protein
MTTKIKAEQGSFPFFEILALIFITLKLTNFIAWSWWWVLAPVWIPIVLVIVLALIVLALLGGK